MTGLSMSKDQIINLASIMIDHDGITAKNSRFTPLWSLNNQYLFFFSEIISIRNEILKDYLPLYNAMNDFVYFYKEVITKVNDRQ